MSNRASETHTPFALCCFTFDSTAHVPVCARLIGLNCLLWLTWLDVAAKCWLHLHAMGCRNIQSSLATLQAHCSY